MSKKNTRQNDFLLGSYTDKLANNVLPSELDVLKAVKSRMVDAKFTKFEDFVGCQRSNDNSLR